MSSCKLCGKPIDGDHRTLCNNCLEKIEPSDEMVEAVFAILDELEQAPLSLFAKQAKVNWDEGIKQHEYQKGIKDGTAAERAKIRERVEREIYYLINELEGDITNKEIQGLQRALVLIEGDGDT